MRKSPVFVLGLVSLALWGCGGGSSSVSTGNSLASGRSALTQMASGTQPTSAQSLQSAFDLFQQAIKDNPGSSEAHFGTAVCLAGLVTQQMDGVSDSSGSLGGAIPGVSGSSGGSSGSVPAPPPPPGKDTPSPPPPPAPGNTSSPGTVSSGATGSGVTISASNTGELPPTPPGQENNIKALPPQHTLGLIWNLTGDLASPYALLHALVPVTDLRFGLLAYYGYSSDNAAARQKMLTDLTTVTQNLATVEADPNFTFSLPLGSGKTATIGLPEVYLFDAYVNALRAELALSLAYVRDVPNSGVTPNPAVELIAWKGSGSSPVSGVPIAYSPFPALDKNKDGKLTPDEYLPASPFLTLRDATLLQTAQQALLTVADKASKGIDGVFARPTTGGDFLIPNSTDVHTILQTERDQALPLLKQAANGPVTLSFPRYEIMTATTIAKQDKGLLRTGKTRAASQIYTLEDGKDGSATPTLPPTVTVDKITVNLAAWFTRPPADLKAFAPTYTLDASGFPQWDKVVYPDSTFGGLFPDGLPASFLF